MNIYKPSDPNDGILKEEATYFYKKIFNKSILPIIIEGYVRANHLLLNEKERTSLKKLTSKKTDIEAIEMAWRARHKTNLLTEKIHILFYLSEAVPQNYTLFINEKKRKLFAFINISIQSIRSIYKLLKGRFLLKRYNLV